MTRTRSDTLQLDQKLVGQWLAPPFQRPLRVNDKVTALAETIKRDGGVIPGVITLGELEGKTYLIDGQHRIQAFLISGHNAGYADVRVHGFDTLGEMGEEFVNLNSRLVNLRPDDILRGLEQSTPALKGIRERCPFIGYDIVRKGGSAPFLSMAVALRAWFASGSETPCNRGKSALALARDLTLFEADRLSTAAIMFEKAWGRDVEFYRLWGNLNFTLCLWLYRRMVLEVKPRVPGRFGRPHGMIAPDLWVKALMQLSTDDLYLDWLVGRQLTDRTRAPAYTKIKLAIYRRVFTETKKNVAFPKPEWATR
jgi:hypothetical protein